nr:hypothetical protein [Candidatus Enterovibrio escacola]
MKINGKRVNTVNTARIRGVFSTNFILPLMCLLMRFIAAEVNLIL